MGSKTDDTLNESVNKKYIEEIPEIEYKKICVISKKTFGDYGVRDIQQNDAWEENPYGEDYAIVPESMIDDIMNTHGFCDIELNSDGTEIVGFTANEIPEIPDDPKIPTELERISALESALLEMIGVGTE